MTRAAPSPDQRVLHGTVFVFLLGGALLVPPLRRWPWIWFAPLLAYSIITASIPRLRQSLNWLKSGAVSMRALLATAGIMMATSLVLIGFHNTVQPNLAEFRAAFPFEKLGGALMAGIIFSIMNATLEELVFRGIFFDAIESQWGSWLALVATSLLFGLGHLRGYPPGPAGACLAVLFGFAVGTLRVWTRGLMLPIAAHIVADATIYCLLLRPERT